MSAFRVGSRCAYITQAQAQGLWHRAHLAGAVVKTDHARLGFGQQLFLALDHKTVVDVKRSPCIVARTYFATQYLPIKSLVFVQDRAIAHDEARALGGVLGISKAGKKLCARLVHEREQLVVAQVPTVVQVGDAYRQTALKRQVRREL